MKARNVIAIFFLLSCGCSSASKKPSDVVVKPIELKEPIYLRMFSTVGRVEETRYHSASFIQTYEDTELRHEKNEVVDFTAVAETKEVDEKKSQIKVLLQTKDKDGFIELEELAFPDIGDKIEMIYTSQAKVVKAGNKPSTSLFFVPPLSLPDTPVQVGDTWTMEHEWTGEKNGVPLHLDMVTVFKAAYPCANGDTCADLEVSGEVKVIGKSQNDVILSSQLKGRMLFSTQKGTIVWSDVRSDEDFADKSTRIKVKSCLVSLLIKPAEEVWPAVDKAFCQPSGELPLAIPGTISK
jgi:hypothetical protein